MDDATALHTAVHVLNADTPASNAPIGGFLCTGEGTPTRLLGWYDDLDLRERKRQKAQILEQPAACGQGVRGGIGHALIMGAPGIGLTEKDHRQCGVDQQHVFHRMAFFLAAITARLLSRILGAHDAPFRPIVPKRGKSGAGAAAGESAGVEGPAVGMTRAAALASATPRRWANSCTDRVGGIPATRDHQDAGSSICSLGGVGAAHYFHTRNQDPDASRHCVDDTETRTISWPNYHSGRNGDYQRIIPVEPVHDLLRRPDSPAELIEFFPAHPHEGGVGAPEGQMDARVIAMGKSKMTNRPFNSFWTRSPVQPNS
jgi:hypothetical protein